jgi:hypothetical protein
MVRIELGEGTVLKVPGEKKTVVKLFGNMHLGPKGRLPAPRLSEAPSFESAALEIKSPPYSSGSLPSCASMLARHSSSDSRSNSSGFVIGVMDRPFSSSFLSLAAVAGRDLLML